MTYEAIVIFVMLVREFVFAVGFLVKTFGFVKFRSDMLNRMHRLENHRKKDSDRCEKIEYGEFLLHEVKVGKAILAADCFNKIFSREFANCYAISGFAWGRG